jgi:hypothetical protein
MVAKLKANFIPRDYQIELFRKLQNLRQRGMTVKEYTKEFYRLDIRTGKREKDDENVSRYINGLRYEIQDEISMVTVRTMKDAYQIALKVEEKLARNQSQWNKRKGLNKGKGVVYVTPTHLAGGSVALPGPSFPLWPEESRDSSLPYREFATHSLFHTRFPEEIRNLASRESRRRTSLSRIPETEESQR